MRAGASGAGGGEAGPLAGEEPAAGALEAVAANLEAVRRRVRAAGGDPSGLSIVAVTKGFGPAAVRAALALGLDHVGENYAAELVAKADRLTAGERGRLRWHFLGALQRNKVGRLAPLVHRYEGLDRLEEGERIARLAPGASVLVEVDFGGRPGRGGVAPEAAGLLVGELRRLPLSVDGLMTVALPGAAATAFAGLAELAGGLGLPELSMGMSEDLELAVAAGATSLRLGRALFGERPGPGHGAGDSPSRPA